MNLVPILLTNKYTLISEVYFLYHPICYNILIEQDIRFKMYTYLQKAVNSYYKYIWKEDKVNEKDNWWVDEQY